MKKAMHYSKLKEKTVQCHICPRKCIIKPNKHGFCRARKNEKGILYSLVYAAPCSVNIDPIEKKPLFHFLPSTASYSIGTAGCNLRCKFCQNWQISQVMPDEVPFIDLPPEKVVEEAINNNCKSIAYTYTEPVTFYEYVYDTAKLARKKGLKNVCVTNAFINQKPLRQLYKYIDAVNIDLKGFTDKYYREITGAWLQPVLDSIKTVHEMGVWLELTNLIIPGLNDDPKIIKKMCEWIKKISPDIPLHFSRFFPDYLMRDYPQTGENTLLKAGKIAKKAGLNYVYIGNIMLPEWGNTYCPKCKELVIERQWFEVTKNKLKNGKCPCGEKIAGVWK
jgi:pyruvate formate lyase activating enzyme